jgi:hypothetical protein
LRGGICPARGCRFSIGVGTGWIASALRIEGRRPGWVELEMEMETLAKGS